MSNAQNAHRFLYIGAVRRGYLVAQLQTVDATGTTGGHELHLALTGPQAKENGDLILRMHLYVLHITAKRRS